MSELTTKMKAFYVHQKILANGNVAAQSLLDMAKDLKVMRDEKLYEELDYKSFESYTESALGIKQSQAYSYISVIERFSEEFFRSNGNLGIRKLELLSRLPEDKRQDFIESNPVEDMTTRELKAAIADKKRLEKELEDLKNKGPEIIERVVEKQTTPVDYFSSKRRLAEMEAKAKELEDQIKHVEEQKKLYERKANLYESDAQKYDAIKREVESLTKERDSVRGEFLMMKEVAGLSKKIEQFIATELAPIKFAPFMSLVKKERVVMKNVAETIGAVQRWVDEMNEMLPDYDVVMNIMESDYEVIHDE